MHAGEALVQPRAPGRSVGEQDLEGGGGDLGQARREQPPRLLGADLEGRPERRGVAPAEAQEADAADRDPAAMDAEALSRSM